jgi:hypothetical protein
MKTATLVPAMSTALVVARPAGRAPPLTAECRGRFILIESRWAQLGLLSPAEALELARDLLDAAMEAGAARAVVNARARRHRLEHPKLWRRPRPSATAADAHRTQARETARNTTSAATASRRWTSPFRPSACPRRGSLPESCSTRPTQRRVRAATSRPASWTTAPPRGVSEHQGHRSYHEVSVAMDAAIRGEEVRP